MRAIGVDVDRVVEGISYDPRVGSHFFHPGIGFGGSCLPKDVAALRYIGETFGVATPGALGRPGGQHHPAHAGRAQAAGPPRRLARGQARRRCWGLTFKGGTEDTRESPAMDVVGLLRNEGALIQAYDPEVIGQRRARPRGACAATCATRALEAAGGADALAILTDWPEFREVPLPEVRAVMRGIVLFDGRNLLSRARGRGGRLRLHGRRPHAHAHRRRSSDG